MESMLAESRLPTESPLCGPGPAGVLLVDHQRAFTDALARCISGDVSMRVVAVATSAEQAVPLIREFRPRLVVLEPNGSIAGLQTLLQTSEVRVRETAVAVLTDGLSDRLLDHVLHLNVSCLSKRDSLDDLLAALRSLVRGERAFSPGIRLRLDQAGHDGPHIVKQRSRLAGLSPRQMQVLQFLAEGKRVKEVAQTMHLSEKAVESHKYRIMNQLNIHDRVELSLYAVREGLITP
jgi:DNA-binding NarL/FixJ family response regulator